MLLKKSKIVNENFNFLLLTLLVLLGVGVSSKALGPQLGPIVFFIVTTVFTSLIIPSKFFVQRLAISSLLIIGFSPIYLIIRGYLSNEPLTSLDLQIYLTSIQILVLIKAAKENFYNFSSQIISLLRNVKYIFISFSSLVVALLIEQILRMRSIGDAVAWIGSGDSKNHLVNGFDITKYGYLDPLTFWIQPVSAPSYLSLIFSQLDTSGKSSINLLQEQMLTYAYVWILLIGVSSLAFSAIFQIIWNYSNNHINQPPVLAFLLVNLIPTLSFILGSSLFDGFFTAIFGIASLVVFVGWFIETNIEQNYKLKHLFLSFCIFVASIFAWMFVIPFTFLLFFLILRLSLKKKLEKKYLVELILISVTLFFAILIHYSTFGQSFIFRVKVVLSTDGVANVTNPNLFFALISIIFIIGIKALKSNKSLGESLIQIASVQLVALFGFKYFSNLTLTSWNYYLLKYQWIMFASLSAVVASLAISKMLIGLVNDFKLKHVVALFFSFIFLFSISESIVNSNSNRVWQKIWNGWDNPRAKTMNAVFEQNINYKNPTLFFHHGYAGESMMANFWLNAFADPIDPIKGWNYTIDTIGDPKQLCDVNYYYPSVTVVTSDLKLEDELSRICPQEIFNVNLELPIYP